MRTVEHGTNIEITGDHANALASLLLAAVIFWIYIAFAQLLIVWIGNEPREISWYLPRFGPGWAWLGITLIVGHFLIPFLLLLQHSIKRSPVALGRVGAWLLVMHYLDAYWLVMPQVHPEGVRPHWLDAAALALVGGAATAAAVWARGTSAPVPIRDPALPLSVHYQEP